MANIDITQAEAGYFCPSPRKGLIGVENPRTMSANH